MCVSVYCYENTHYFYFHISLIFIMQFISMLIDCGLKGELMTVTMDPVTGLVTRDESSLPVCQVYMYIFMNIY